MDKYNQAIAESQVTTDDALVASKVNEILEKHLEENRKPEVLRQLFNSIDLTTLKSTDSQQSVANSWSVSMRLTMSIPICPMWRLCACIPTLCLSPAQCSR